MKQSIDKQTMSYLTITKDNKIFYGCCQSWYKTKKQKSKGCAPTVASNLFLCISKANNLSTTDSPLCTMQTMWHFLRPKRQGVKNVKRFAKGCNRLFKHKNLPYVCKILSYSKRHKPSFDTVKNFILQSFCCNCPVAFLNLNNNTIPHLEQWHWVTIVKFVGSTATIFDGEFCFDIDLLLWHNTTQDGGFVSFV